MNIFVSAALFYPSKLGGPANAIYWFCKALAKRGHTVRVVTTYTAIDDSTIVPDKWMFVDGINVLYCSSVYSPKSQFFKESIRCIKESDVVILSSVCYKPETVLALIATLLRKPTIWSPRGEFSKSAINGRLDKKLFFKIIKYSLKRNVIFHATSNGESIDIRTVLGQNTHIIQIPNYMELPDMEQHESPDNPYFIFLGRIAPIKSIDKLIEACVLSKSFRDSNFTLHIVGGCEEQFNDYYNSLRDLVKHHGLDQKIFFQSPLYGTEKFKALRNARFLILVSESENFGNVVIESLSQGTPAITSQGTPWEILKNKKAGFWIENSPNIIAEVIDRCIQQNNSVYQNYRENALNVSSYYNIFTNIGIWEKQLEDLCK